MGLFALDRVAAKGMKATKILVLSRLVEHFVKNEKISVAESVLVAAQELKIVPNDALNAISAMHKLALRW